MTIMQHINKTLYSKHLLQLAPPLAYNKSKYIFTDEHVVAKILNSFLWNRNNSMIYE